MEILENLEEHLVLEIVIELVNSGWNNREAESKAYEIYQKTLIGSIQFLMSEYGLYCRRSGLYHHGEWIDEELEVYTQDNECVNLLESFKTIQELNLNAGHCIRKHGTTENAKNYIGDKFLPIVYVLEDQIREMATTWIAWINTPIN